MNREQMESAVEFFRKSNRNWSIEENEKIQILLYSAKALLNAGECFSPKYLTYEHREIKIGESYVKEIDPRYCAGSNDRADEDTAILAKCMMGLEEVISNPPEVDSETPNVKVKAWVCIKPKALAFAITQRLKGAK